MTIHHRDKLAASLDTAMRRLHELKKRTHAKRIAGVIDLGSLMAREDHHIDSTSGVTVPSDNTKPLR